MAAEWFYVSNRQQAGPVELDALRQMLSSGALTHAALVFGPGVSDWTAARQIPALAGAAAAPASPGYADGPSVAPASMLAYRGVETSQTGLSTAAMEALRQTKPWVRFMSVMTFIGAGFMVLGGFAVMAVGSFASRGGGTGIPPAVGAVYIVMAIIYVIPGVLLGRYASSIARLMQSQRMTDVEQALVAQKSFWKFVGMLMIIGMVLYALIIVGAVIFGVMK